MSLSKKNILGKSSIVIKPVVTDPNECPFREYRDAELQQEAWGMGFSAFRAYTSSKGQAFPKPPQDYVWNDEQIQPMPRSVRQSLSRYERAEDLALNKWNAEVAIYDETDACMVIPEIQLSYAKVIDRSSFCRRVLSICFVLEKAETFVVEHQWEGFNCVMGPEGWRAKAHIYSPGIKPGGGIQHRPTLSKNGCYLVRLYYLGAWRCIWVSDMVPVDASGEPLLPFAPLVTRSAVPKPPPVKGAPPPVTTPMVYLWPLLICKALLKLAAPDMNDNESLNGSEDEEMSNFDMLHALTGGLVMKYHFTDPEDIWQVLTTEIPAFSWDEDDETQASTIRTKSTKKPTARDVSISKKPCIVCVVLNDTKALAPYHLPGITPGYEMTLLVTMTRDVPLKKPLPEPDVELWKHYRWVDWARSHGLYDAYDCPRTRFLRMNGLLKLSRAPHLLDVQSTESITFGFIKAEGSPNTVKKAKDMKNQTPSIINHSILLKLKEELREWILFSSLHRVMRYTTIVSYPSLYQLTSATNSPIVRITKTPISRNLDVLAPKTAPLYLQIDGPEINTLRMSLSVLHPRIMANAGVLMLEHIESAYIVLECFEWFKDRDLPKTISFIRTSGYDAVQVNFPPGRHYCRLWIHSRMNFHTMLISESDLVLGPKDFVQCAATRECPWAFRFLLNLGSSFLAWLKNTRSNTALQNIIAVDKEFYKAYLPDLTWDNEVVGYDRSLLHWMFRQALQVHLRNRLAGSETELVYTVLRRYFRDPDFGHLPKPKPRPYDLRAMVDSDPCDCVLPEIEELELSEEMCEQIHEEKEKELVPPEIMDKLIQPPVPPAVSNICDMATEEVPCALLKEEREKIVKKHEAATTIQAYWRGTWARKCLHTPCVTSSDALKIIQDTTIGSQENLSNLMNEFFKLYPGARYAYSVASALSGVYGLQQYNGTSPITYRCKWIPYFQESFICHTPCKVHFDLNSTIQNSTFAIYNSDTGQQLPQAYNAHKTFDLQPNINGYTVTGHGSLNEPLGTNSEAVWQLTVMTSVIGAVHICNNDQQQCTEFPLSPATKLHIDELFVPNRRNILGGIQMWVSQYDSVSFRVASSSLDLEMIAILKSTTISGEWVEVATCSGVGEIYWPYIQLKPLTKSTTPMPSSRSLKSLKGNKGEPRGKMSQSLSKFKPTDPRAYTIQVVAPAGWPLTIAQWTKVDEVRNSLENIKLESQSARNALRDKPISSKDKASGKQAGPANQPDAPLPDDAYVELECSLTIGRGTDAVRDNSRDVEFSNARLLWAKSDPGRNKRGAEIRKDFRDEYLEVPPPPPSESSGYFHEQEILSEHLHEAEEEKKTLAQGPTPVTGAASIEEAEEEEKEEEAKFLTMPEVLYDKFQPLLFVPLCMKELEEHDRVVISANMAEAAKNERQARIDAEQSRREDLQFHNELSVLGRQKERCQLTENLYVEPQWSESVQQMLDEREEAIINEVNLRLLSATLKKKQEPTKGKK